VRFLMLTCEYPPIGGGAATVCRFLGRALVGLGHEVDVVTAGMSGLPAMEMDDGVRILRTGGYRRMRHYSTALEQATFLYPTYRTAARLLRERHYDVIHAHFVVPTGWVACRLGRRFGVPYAVTAHGSDVPGYNPDRFALMHRLLMPLWRRVLREASWVTSPSRFLADLLRRRCPVPVTVIPNPFAFERLPRRRRRNMILAVSRLVPRKGVQFLVEAMRSLPPDWELVVAGDGPSRAALERQAEGLPVRFTGFLPHERVAELYAEAAIFVLPSLVENFPMVLLEAMNAGCAVVTTDAYGCGELAERAGVLVRPEDSEGLHRTLARLIADPAERERLGAAARARAAEFTPEKVASRFVALFRDRPPSSAAPSPGGTEARGLPGGVLLNAADCASRDAPTAADRAAGALRVRGCDRWPSRRS